MKGAFILLIVLAVVTYIKSESGDNENINPDVEINGQDNDEFIPDTKEEMKKDMLMEEKAQLDDEAGEFAEGDIKVDRRFLEFRKAATFKKDVITKNFRWPKGEVIYKYKDAKTASTLRKVVGSAIADFKKFTCIKFQLAQTTPRGKAYIEFRTDDDGCYSHLGRKGGKQEINLEAPGCINKGVVIHEIMHALGFFHEHVRLDRDRFVRINFRNIDRKMKFNFEKYAIGKAGYEGENYDYDSIMHYPIWAFSRNKRYTITPVNVPKTFDQKRLGQRLGFSAIDLKQINKAYRCKAKAG